MISKKKTKFILIIFLILMCKSTFAWEKFKTYDVWIDKESIFSTNKMGSKVVHIWVVSNTSLPNRQDVQSVKSLVNINCNKRYVDMTYSYYSQLQGSGEKLGTGYWESNIEPDTVYRDLFNEYCKAWWKVW